MDFARKQLEKYGWTEGKGLGKHESGISKAIRPKLKFDNAGIGHDRAEQFTYHWWENVYNEAANNINVKKTNDSVTVELNDNESINITTNKYAKFKKSNKTDNKSNKMEYGVFLKKSTLTQSGLVAINEETTMEDTSIDVAKKKLNCNSGISSLTDEEIFQACGGRTAHKGARHGLNLKGKLARIEEQERKLLLKMQQSASTSKTSLRDKRSGVSPLLKSELIEKDQDIHEENHGRVDKSCATDRFLVTLNATSAVPKCKHSKKKCEFCHHKRCRCNVFEVIGDEIKKAGLGKRKLFDLPDNLPSHIGADSKYEQIRNPNDTTQIYSSPYSETAQNKRRKLGVSSEEEQKCENKKHKRKIKNKAKKIKKQVSKLSDSLDKFNMSD